MMAHHLTYAVTFVQFRIERDPEIQQLLRRHDRARQAADRALARLNGLLTIVAGCTVLLMAHACLPALFAWVQS